MDLRTLHAVRVVHSDSMGRTRPNPTASVNMVLRPFLSFGVERMKWLTLAVILMAAVLLIVGICIVWAVPQSNTEAIERAESVAPIGNQYEWRYVNMNGMIAWDTFTIPEELSDGFRSDFLDSMHRNKLRTLNALNGFNPYTFVEEDDKYVKFIANHILDVTDGYDELARATAIFNFVNTAISYNTDDNLFGMEDYVLHPMETLYLHSGDCEDSSILLVSLFKACGYEAVLVDFVGHVGSAVKLSSDRARGESYELSDGRYYYCESAADDRRDIGAIDSRFAEEEPHFWTSGETLLYGYLAQYVFASYREAIWRMFAI